MTEKISDSTIISMSFSDLKRLAFIDATSAVLVDAPSADVADRFKELLYKQQARDVRNNSNHHPDGVGDGFRSISKAMGITFEVAQPFENTSLDMIINTIVGIESTVMVGALQSRTLKFSAADEDDTGLRI